MQPVIRFPEYFQISHSADKSIIVFGENFVQFFINAANGMYKLMEIETDNSSTLLKKPIMYNEIDIESLLVSFLSDLLYFTETGIGFHRFILTIKKYSLKGKMYGYPIKIIHHGIKAVTFNEMRIRNNYSILSTKIVFDV